MFSLSHNIYAYIFTCAISWNSLRTLFVCVIATVFALDTLLENSNKNLEIHYFMIWVLNILTIYLVAKVTLGRLGISVQHKCMRNLQTISHLHIHPSRTTWKNKTSCKINDGWISFVCSKTCWVTACFLLFFFESVVQVWKINQILVQNVSCVFT